MPELNRRDFLAAAAVAGCACALDCPFAVAAGAPQETTPVDIGTAADFPKDAIPFDAPGVELSHRGEDCTFETLIKQAHLRDRRLIHLAEVVHEADLRDGKYPHEEARGIDVAIRALLAAAGDDHQVLAQGMTLFEGLYATTPKKR